MLLCKCFNDQQLYKGAALHVLATSYADLQIEHKFLTITNNAHVSTTFAMG